MKWRVYNRHPQGFTHKEKFRDETIEIKAGGFVLMDYEDAVRFKGQYFPMIKNAQGAEDPKGFKVIHLEPDDGSSAAQPIIMQKDFVCHIDGAKFPTQALLDNYLKMNYADVAFKDESIEEEIAKEEIKKRGRPAKERTA
jgi:hypothetical protein